MRRVALAAIAAAALLTGCGMTVDESGATTEDRAAFALAWSQQTETDKDSMCLSVVLYGEQGVADRALKMKRPKVFARLLVETCEREGR